MGRCTCMRLWAERIPIEVVRGFKMAKFRMHVNLDNGAFENEGELARILRVVANQVEYLGDKPLVLSDINGNNVGMAYIED
jgi:hypothetical protein